MCGIRASISMCLPNEVSEPSLKGIYYTCAHFTRFPWNAFVKEKCLKFRWCVWRQNICHSNYHHTLCISQGCIDKWFLVGERSRLRKYIVQVARNKCSRISINMRKTLQFFIVIYFTCLLWNGIFLKSVQKFCKKKTYYKHTIKYCLYILKKFVFEYWAK